MLLVVALAAAAITACGKNSEDKNHTKAQTSSENMEENTQDTTIEPFTEESQTESQEDTEAYIPENAHKIIIASDIHYFSDKLTDYSSGFNYMVEHGDGRMIQYCKEIVNAWMEEVIKQKPEVVILSGDLTLNGEKQSHEDFVKILSDFQKHDIKVIVIPGNHDINNVAAAKFEGSEMIPTQQTTPSEFYQIYQDYGYNDALSKDTDSLSYVWELSDDLRIMMIDSNMYEYYAKVGGIIKDSTYEWMEEQFEDAYEAGAQVLTVTHHNILDESEVYMDDCTIEHSEREIEQLENWNIPLHLSGHLHVQHYKKSSDNKNAFYEIVTGSLITPPCTYGVLYYNSKGKYSYQSRQVDMKSWAKIHGVSNPDLLNWDTYKSSFLKKVFINQAYEEYKNLGIDESLSDYDKERMADMYARLNIAYHAGEAYKVAADIEASDEYNMWINMGYSSKFIDNIEFIIRDAKENYNKLDIK